MRCCDVIQFVNDVVALECDMRGSFLKVCDGKHLRLVMIAVSTIPEIVTCILPVQGGEISQAFSGGIRMDDIGVAPVYEGRH